MKKLVVFDLDGTLAESKSPLDAEMATLLCVFRASSLLNLCVFQVASAKTGRRRTRFAARDPSAVSAPIAT